MERRIDCFMTGVHRGADRFSSTDPHNWPKLKAWRCDLTGLSQVYNLYFVACNDTIHVYQPSFPDQTLTSVPALVLRPPVSPQTGNGIDDMDPHSITRLHLDYLGQDEIILVTCDDGDVVGYRIEEIQKALKRWIIPRHDEKEQGEVRVFLHINVRASAWGLAVHREARMIAISANTHEVTVWACALTQDGSSSVPGRLIPRHKETAIMLTAECNIPSVSFNNSGDDPAGRWLVSSSIDGKTMVWDLHKLPWHVQNREKPLLTMEMGWCASLRAPYLDPGRCACPDSSSFPHGAWGALFLTTSSAHEMSSVEDASVGLEYVEPGFAQMNAYKKWFTVKRERVYSPIDFIDFEESEESPTDVEESLVNDDMVISESDSEHGAALVTTYTSQHTGHHAESEMLPVESTNLLGSNEQGEDDEIAEEESGSEVDFAEEDSDGQLPTLSTYLGPAVPLSPGPREPYLKISQFGPIPPPQSQPGPLLVVSKEEIYLIQQPFAHNDRNFYDRVLCIRHPLNLGKVSPYMNMDRMCYSCQIPELGLFIIGSPIGRAAVFSVYWTKKEGSAQRQYGFQLEYMLPFKKHNDRELWNFGLRMIGVAVGPLQGMFDRKSTNDGQTAQERSNQPRRWRLLMYYADHTVISFELSKPRGRDSPSVGELIV